MRTFGIHTSYMRHVYGIYTAYARHVNGIHGMFTAYIWHIWYKYGIYGMYTACIRHIYMVRTACMRHILVIHPHAQPCTYITYLSETHQPQHIPVTRTPRTTRAAAARILYAPAPPPREHTCHMQQRCLATSSGTNSSRTHTHTSRTSRAAAAGGKRNSHS